MIPVPPPEEKSRIEELKKSLYSREAPDVRTRRKLRWTEKPTEVKSAWERPPEEDMRPADLNSQYEDHSMSFFTKLLIASAIFFIAAVGIGAYLFFNGSNLISANNIDIAITGPVSIPGGEPVSFDVNVINKNNIDLQLVDMSVNFPAGTTDPSNPAQSLQTYRKLIGDLPTGASTKETVHALIFGEENVQKQITVVLTYGIKGSTAVFTKTQTYDVLINSSPITVTASSFKQITSGQEFDLTVDLKSNSQETLKNVLLKAAYPFGYTFISANIPAQSDKATWKIGDIPPGADRKVVIHGRLEGEDSDTRVFRFTVGAASPSDPKQIDTQYTALSEDMTIEKPFISVGVSVDGDTPSSGDHIGQFGQSEHVTINWFNNLPTSVSNLTIDAKLSGTAYDKNSVQPDFGYFRSTTDDIIWNQQTNSDLASAGAGSSGTVSFTVNPRDLGTPSNPVVNPNLLISVSVSGNRTQESNVSGALSSAITRNIRISSNISLTGRIVRTVGPFANTGPVPPVAEKATTYTIIWTVDNTSNPVNNAQVVATLPPYVKWLGAISPATEDLTYDSNSGAVTWNIGNVPANTLGSAKRKEADFQISFQPGVNQVNQSPTLVNQATLTATDSFTGGPLHSQQDSLTTRFSTDPAYKDGNDRVTK
jgi:hypothetical protein